MKPANRSEFTEFDSSTDAAAAKIREALLTRRAGRSSVEFAPGSAINSASRTLRTVGVSVVGVDAETAAAAYAYLYRVQVLTQCVRFFIVTDGSDLRTIRRFGWLTEHIMSREPYEQLEPGGDWVSMCSEQVVSAFDRLDAAASIVVGCAGITDADHGRLMALLRMNIPRAGIMAGI